MRKKILTAAVTIGMCLAMAGTAMAGEWKQQGNAWYYQDDYGNYVSDAGQYIDGTWYMFDENGKWKEGVTVSDSVIDGVYQLSNEYANIEVEIGTNSDDGSLYIMGNGSVVRNLETGNVVSGEVYGERLTYLGAGRYSLGENEDTQLILTFNNDNSVYIEDCYGMFGGVGFSFDGTYYLTSAFSNAS